MPTIVTSSAVAPFNQPVDVAPCISHPGGLDECDGIGRKGNSGLSKCSKFRWALPFSIVWVCMIITNGTRSIYIVIFGGPTTQLGVLFLALSFMYPFFQAAAGLFFKHEISTGIFPITVWGRYTGLVIYACVTVIVASLMVLVPPSMDSIPLCVWAGITYTLLYFAQAIIFVAVQASEVEIFPFQEERVELVMYKVLASIVGGAFTIVGVLLVTAESSFLCRMLTGAVLAFGVAICGVVSIPPYVLAQQPRNGHEMDRSFLQDLKYAFSIDAVRWLSAAAALDSSAFGVNLFFVLYYLIYNLGYNTAEASLWYGAILGSVTIFQVIFTIPATWFFKREPPLVDMQTATIAGTLTQAALWPAFMTWVDSPGYLILLYALVVATNIPGTFYTPVCRSWIVDEDVHRTDLRREAMFQSAMAALQFFCISAFPSILLVILGSLGFDPQDCTGDADDKEAQDICENNSRDMQPNVVTEYLMWVQVIVPSVMLIGAAFCYSRFPIKGKRLDLLNNRQAETFKKIPRRGSTTIVPSSLPPSPVHPRFKSDPPVSPMHLAQPVESEDQGLFFGINCVCACACGTAPEPISTAQKIEVRPAAAATPTSTGSRSMSARSLSEIGIVKSPATQSPVAAVSNLDEKTNDPTDQSDLSGCELKDLDEEGGGTKFNKRRVSITEDEIE